VAAQDKLRATGSARFLPVIVKSMTEPRRAPKGCGISICGADAFAAGGWAAAGAVIHMARKRVKKHANRCKDSIDILESSLFRGQD
jgi:hypothetical protein